MINRKIVEEYGGKWHGRSDAHNGVLFEFNGVMSVADPEDGIGGFVVASYGEELKAWLKSQ